MKIDRMKRGSIAVGSFQCGEARVEKKGCGFQKKGGSFHAHTNVNSWSPYSIFLCVFCNTNRFLQGSCFECVHKQYVAVKSGIY